MTKELPGGCVLVKHELQFHIQRIMPGGIKCGEVILPIRLDHDQRAVHAVAETCCAGDFIHRIVSLLLSDVVRQKDSQVEPVGDLLQHRQGCVVPGVAVPASYGKIYQPHKKTPEEAKILRAYSILFYGHRPIGRAFV